MRTGSGWKSAEASVNSRAYSESRLTWIVYKTGDEAGKVDSSLKSLAFESHWQFLRSNGQ